MPKFKTVQAWLLVALLAAGCGGGGSDAPPALDAAPPLSVVVLGDSIASGEGINYGYIYYTGSSERMVRRSHQPGSGRATTSSATTRRRPTAMCWRR